MTRRRRRFVIPLCVTVVALVLMLKIFQLHQRANVNLVGNEYYNEIITERFYLLAHEAQPKSVAPAAQESEKTGEYRATAQCSVRESVCDVKSVESLGCG